MHVITNTHYTAIIRHRLAEYKQKTERIQTDYEEQLEELKSTNDELNRYEHIKSTIRV